VIYLKELYRALKPLKRKLILEKWLHLILLSTIIAMGLNIGLLILSKFTLISYIYLKFIGIIILSLFTGSLTLLFCLPDMRKLVNKGDSLGYKERFVTAFEILSHKGKQLNSFEKMVVEDAIEKARKANFKREYHISLPEKKLKVLAVMLIGAMIVGFAPSPVKEKLEYQMRLKEVIEEKTKEIEKVQNELKENKELTEAQVKQINKELDELKKNIKQAKNEADIVRARQKTQEELKRISKDSVQRDLKKIGESLSQHELTRELGDQLQKGNIEDIKRSLEELRQELANMDQNQLKELANAFKEAAESLESDSALRQALSDYQEAITNGNLSDLQECYQQLSEQLAQRASENEDLRKAIEKINEAMNKDNNLSQNQGQNQSQGQNQNQRQNQNQGQNQGQGQGRGQGQSQGQGQDQGKGQGQGRGRGHVPNENIYSRQAEDKEDFDAYVEGQKNQGGQFHQKEEKMIGKKGESVPYQEVFQEYKKEALNLLEDDNIPYGIKNLVKEYFTSLE